MLCVRVVLVVVGSSVRHMFLVILLFCICVLLWSRSDLGVLGIAQVLGSVLCVVCLLLRGCCLGLGVILCGEL
jgi:hypothetical protein